MRNDTGEDCPSLSKTPRSSEHKDRFETQSAKNSKASHNPKIGDNKSTTAKN